MFSLLPEISTRTDADGRFILLLPRKTWLLARAGTTKEHSDDSQHFWVIKPEKIGEQVLLANDNEVKGADALFHTLGVSTNELAGKNQLKAIDPDPALIKWLVDARTRAKSAIADAETEQLAHALAKVQEATNLPV